MVMGVTRENTILESYYEVADAPRFKLEGSWLRFKYKPARLQLMEPAIFVSNVSLLPQLIEPPNIIFTKLSLSRMSWIQASSGGQWWMQLCGFSDPFQRDANGFSPLHHALDASSYSLRAEYAAPALIHLTALDIINAETSPIKPGWPSGYTCLHFVCEGSDRYRLRNTLASHEGGSRYRDENDQQE